MDCSKIWLKVGSKGDNVKSVQEKLKAEGYYTGSVDGSFGKYTGLAVKHFQKDKKLKQDEIIGPLTCKALGLNSECSSQAKTSSNSSSASDSCYTSPRVELLRQPNGFTCCPTSTAMALYELGIVETEDEMATLEGTTSSGTSHPQFEAGVLAEAKRKGVNLKVSFVNFSSVGFEGLGKMIADPKIAVIIHGICTGWRRYYKSYSGGHYVYPWKVCLKNGVIWIMDPDRGDIWYPLDEFKKGISANSQPSLCVITRV